MTWEDKQNYFKKSFLQKPISNLKNLNFLFCFRLSKYQRIYSVESQNVLYLEISSYVSHSSF